MKPSPSVQAQEIAHLEKLKVQIAADIAALQEKEASLRDYEQRIRQLIEAAPPEFRFPSNSPFPTEPEIQVPVRSDGDLDAAWEKYERSHALLEAARRALVDERLAMRERENELQQREDTVTQRELAVATREAELVAAKETPPEMPAKARASLTTAPFMLAKNLFTSKRDKAE